MSVDQDSLIFEGTIKDNIVLGDEFNEDFLNECAQCSVLTQIIKEKK
jgi:ABC-type transport system involved in cytochrome bd biosynthesis fused ATPase/permease subunit